MSTKYKLYESSDIDFVATDWEGKGIMDLEIVDPMADCYAVISDLEPKELLEIAIKLIRVASNYINDPDLNIKIQEAIKQQNEVD